MAYLDYTGLQYLKGKLDDTYETIADANDLKSDLAFGLNTGLIPVHKTLNWINAYVNSSGVIKSSSASKTCLVTMYAGETVTIGTRNTSIGIINSTQNNSIAINDTVTIIQKTTSVDRYEEYSYTATDTINIVLCVRASEYNLQFTKMTDLLTAVEKNTEDVADNKFAIENGIRQISSFNLQDIQSNILAYEDERVVEGDGNYVYEIMYSYRGTFAEGDVFWFKYDTCVGATADPPVGVTVYSGTTLLHTTNYTYTITAADIAANVDEVRFTLYPAKGTALPSGKATFTGITIYKGSQLETTLTGVLKETIFELPVGEIPTYYTEDDYLSAKASSINTLASDADDVFIFITDIHWELNAKHSPYLINYLSKKCNIPRLFDGGDLANGIDRNAYKLYRDYFNERLYHIVGNHDRFNEITGKNLYYAFDNLNNDQVGNPFNHYYYIENVQQKIRYVILNTFYHTGNDNTQGWSYYDNDQITWFSNTALDVPNDWDVIVFTHYLKTTSYITGGSDIGTAIDNFNADAGRSGKVLAVFQGHTHWDGVYHTSGGVPVITTTCDKWDLSNESDIIPAEGIAFREHNTISEHAFDVVVLDRANEKFTLVRIGALAQNNVDKYRTDEGFTWIGTLEEREISYGEE